jgi:hypothetical protein
MSIKKIKKDKEKMYVWEKNIYIYDFIKIK